MKRSCIVVSRKEGDREPDCNDEERRDPEAAVCVHFLECKRRPWWNAVEDEFGELAPGGSLESTASSRLGSLGAV
jgi:hypothetical protein